MEYLPDDRERIEAELRGLVAGWKAVGHSFTEWARTVGGILMVGGFTDILANAAARKTVDDQVRRAIGLLGAARPEEWLPAAACAEAGLFEDAVQWQRKMMDHPGTSKDQARAARQWLELYEQSKAYHEE